MFIFVLEEDHAVVFLKIPAVENARPGRFNYKVNLLRRDIVCHEVLYSVT